MVHAFIHFIGIFAKFSFTILSILWNFKANSFETVVDAIYGPSILLLAKVPIQRCMTSIPIAFLNFFIGLLETLLSNVANLYRYCANFTQTLQSLLQFCVFLKHQFTIPHIFGHVLLCEALKQSGSIVGVLVLAELLSEINVVLSVAVVKVMH